MYEGILQRVIDQLGSLPGIGPKSASRLAFYLLEAPKQEVLELSNSLKDLKEQVGFCEICGNVSQEKLCQICQNPARDAGVICVVQQAKDIQVIEKTREFFGLYHCLGGAINPIAGIGPEQLRIKQLLKRLSSNKVSEVILALDPNIEGEATTTYLSRQLKSLEIKVSRLASGLPIGGDLEYADEVTVSRALEARVEL